MDVKKIALSLLVDNFEGRAMTLLDFIIQTFVTFVEWLKALFGWNSEAKAPVTKTSTNKSKAQKFQKTDSKNKVTASKKKPKQTKETHSKKDAVGKSPKKSAEKQQAEKLEKSVEEKPLGTSWMVAKDDTPKKAGTKNSKDSDNQKTVNNKQANKAKKSPKKPVSKDGTAKE